MEKSLHVYWSIKITSPEGIALSMLCLIHHSRVPSKVPKPYPGLTIILGKTPDCPSRSKKGESIGTLACVEELTLMWAAHTFRQQVLQG